MACVTPPVGGTQIGLVSLKTLVGDAVRCITAPVSVAQIVLNRIVSRHGASGIEQL